MKGDSMATKQYLPELEKMPEAKAREWLDLKAQKMINNVIGTKNYIPKNERVIYVSNDGDDENCGLSKGSPIKTIPKLNEIMKDGDTVLFRRGDIFRGSVEVTKGGVTFSAYGEGVKPMICGCLKNYADVSLWEPTEYENVYRCTELFENVGLILFDPRYCYGAYDEKYADRAMRGKNGFMELCDLKDDLVFYSDRETKELFLCSVKGNPGERFCDIEISAKVAVFNGGAPDVTFDNLWVNMSGCHGISSGTAKNRTVTNCVFSWIGGAAFGGEKRADGTWNTTRYGNAVQIYGGCENFRVENNWLYQIFDTAITHQYGGYSEGDCIQDGVIYRNNISEFCFWHIEFYNGNREGTRRYVKDVYMTGNFCRYGGYGWGCKGREGGSPMFCGSSICDDVTNFVSEHNIFCHSLGVLVQRTNDAGYDKMIVRNNVYVDPFGAKLARIAGTVYPFDENTKDTLRTLVHEEEPTVVYMKKPNFNF